MKLSKSLKYLKNKNIYKQKNYYGSTPLNTEFPGVPRPTENIRYKWSAPSVSNVDGIRVVAIESNTPQTSVTLSFQSGSRVENANNTGAAALLKHFAYRATPSHTQVGITRAIELNTVSFHSAVSREDISYNANLTRYQLNSFLPVFSEISRPKIREYEVRELEGGVLDQSSTWASCPQNLLVDRFHRVAYRGEGLGNVISPLASRASLDHAEWVDALRQYVSQYFVRERAIIVGVGYAKDQLNELVQSSLASIPKGTNETPRSVKYNGGEHLGDRSGSSHVLLGFEGLPIVSPHVHALNLAFTILGGGNRLSFDGPGHGQTSLLNRNVVEKLSSVVSANAYNANYRDSGLFGLYAHTNGNVASVVDALVEQVQLLNKVDASQLEVAKRQLKLNLSFHYQNTINRGELAKRYVQAGLEPVCVDNFVSSVDSISLDDFKRVVKSVFSSRPVLVAEGDIAGLPGVEQLSKRLN